MKLYGLSEDDSRYVLSTFQSSCNGRTKPLTAATGLAI